jgi:N-methylhydantoinase A/oxoprolinase/acetone carboxylase beta subunit
MSNNCKPDSDRIAPGQPSCNPAAPDGFIGIGIDAGGTYTDAVIYDTAYRELLGKNKALTTKWDYAAGIRNALNGLDSYFFPQIQIVALSTTLATNAIVEGDGQKVGMIIMPPYGLFNPEDITYKPLALVSGQLEINGDEIVPVDIVEVTEVARCMVTEEGVEAFAVSGFAGSINPAHELAVKSAIQLETGCAVTCGHELSDLLNFKTRAYTALFNARLIPRLVQLLKNLENVLVAAGIRAPIVVVRGDGSLMSARAAAERPVETILSGPAASVSGARYLTGIDTALVVDMGGTTTDTAALENGEVGICAAGAAVGGHRTHVSALAIRTVGLGGDSLVHRGLSGFAVGPRRVVPVSWTALQHPRTRRALEFIERHPDQYAGASFNTLQILTLNSEPHLHLAPITRAAVGLLRTRPYSAAELIHETGASYEGALELDPLEKAGIISRSGPTPMDLLHVTGRFTHWDRPAAELYVRLMARGTGQTPETLAHDLLNSVTQRITLEVLKRQLDEDIDPEAIHTCQVCKTLLHNVFSGGSRHYTAAIHLKRPVIGIGAPVGYFLPQAAAFLNATVVIPEHSDVANAIGAITSQVVITRRLRIVVESDRTFAIQGLAGKHRFLGLEEADRFARRILERMVTDEARTAGTRAEMVSFSIEDQILTADDGTDIFKSRIIRGRLTGAPDLLSVLATAGS